MRSWLALLAVAICGAAAPAAAASRGHAYGKETLRGIAARFLRGLRPGSRPR